MGQKMTLTHIDTLSRLTYSFYHFHGMFQNERHLCGRPEIFSVGVKSNYASRILKIPRFLVTISSLYYYEIVLVFWTICHFYLSFFLNLSFLAIHVFLGHFQVIFGSFYPSIESFWTDLKLLILLEDEFILWLGLFQCRYFENAICNPILTNAPIGSIISFEQRTTFNLIFSGNPKVGMTSLKFQLNL